MKDCVTCNQRLSFDSFHRLHSEYKNTCKSCISKRNKRYKIENPGKIKKRNQRHYQKIKDNPVYKNRVSQYFKLYHQINKDRLNKKGRDWYSKNKERCAIYVSLWMKRNRDKRIAAEHRRRLAKNSNGRNDLTAVQITLLKKQMPFLSLLLQ